MLINDSLLVGKLRHIAASLAPDPAERQDLMQEALIHLWILESRSPKQSASWYLQSCRFHLQHYLARGKSLDSRKRSAGRTELPDEEEPATLSAAGLVGHHDYAAQATVNDLVGTLSDKLNFFEKQMLDYLLDGLTLREVANQLGVSFPTALKYRRKIAGLFRRLDTSATLQLQLSPVDDPGVRGSFLLRFRSTEKSTASAI